MNGQFKYRSIFVTGAYNVHECV